MVTITVCKACFSLLSSAGICTDCGGEKFELVDFDGPLHEAWTAIEEESNRLRQETAEAAIWDILNGEDIEPESFPEPIAAIIRTRLQERQDHEEWQQTQRWLERWSLEG